MLHTLGVLLAQFLRQTLVVLVLEGKASLGKNGVFLDDFVQNVDVQGQAFGTFELLDQFAADGAPHAVLVVQLLDAVRAQGVAAVHQDAGNALTDVVLECAELANVKATRLVVQVHYLIIRVHLDRRESRTNYKLFIINLITLVQIIKTSYNNSQKNLPELPKK